MKKLNRHIHVWITVISLAMAIGGAIWWHISLNPRFSPVIENQVYRSAQLSTSSLDAVIQAYGIRTISMAKGLRTASGRTGGWQRFIKGGGRVILFAGGLWTTEGCPW